MADTELQQLAKTNRNPSQETRYQELLRASGGGGGGGLNIPAFNFNYGQAELEAREKLRPYYEQKLADAKGDIEVAKKLIEDDYASGVRYRQEELTGQLAQDTALAGQENRNLMDTLNKRGVLFSEQGRNQPGLVMSGLAGQEQGLMSTKQMQRKQAIERAIARQEEVAGLSRRQQLEQPSMDYKRKEQDILEEKENKVQTQFVPNAYERAKAAYENTYGQSLNQAINTSVSANPYLQQLGWA